MSAELYPDAQQSGAQTYTSVQDISCTVLDSHIQDAASIDVLLRDRQEAKSAVLKAERAVSPVARCQIVPSTGEEHCYRYKVLRRKIRTEDHSIAGIQDQAGVDRAA